MKAVGAATYRHHMARRPRPEDPAITRARLDGTAHRLLRENADEATAVAELRALTTDATLLGTAAGTALGGWQCGTHDGDRVAALLTAAGGDEDVRDRVAAETVQRVRGGMGKGIGNP